MEECIKGEFVTFKRMVSNVQVDCWHNCAPREELHVEDIVREVVGSVGCSSVFANVSRVVADLNREVSEQNKEAILEYREVLKGNLCLNGYLKRPYLLIVLHGMKNREGKDVEIGTREGELARPEVVEWFVGRMKEKFSESKVVVDDEFKGPSILKHYRHGNDFFEGFGENLNIFQVELSRDLRENSREEVVEKIVEVVGEFERKFV